jgi:hypothetical protein
MKDSNNVFSFTSALRIENEGFADWLAEQDGVIGYVVALAAARGIKISLSEVSDIRQKMEEASRLLTQAQEIESRVRARLELANSALAGIPVSSTGQVLEEV